VKQVIEGGRSIAVVARSLEMSGKSYFPQVGTRIWRELPTPLWRGVKRVRGNAQQAEQLKL
jgi:hypothetical protein